LASLRDIQSAFVQALFERQEAWIARHILAGGMVPGARLAIYRNNVVHNYYEALRAVFPVVERLVGEEFFGHAARRYALACPSRSGDIQAYGESFPEFLAALPGASGLPYLRTKPFTPPSTRPWTWSRWPAFPRSAIRSCASRCIRRAGCSLPPIRCIASGR
jgi:Putative DNA-binding domain